LILYAAADLIWASRIKAVADALKVPCRPARTREMLEARLGDCHVKALLVDLDKGDEAIDLITFLRGPEADDRRRGIAVVAWGPHIDHQLLKRAGEAGADTVMTRGAFDRELERLLLALDARS